MIRIRCACGGRRRDKAIDQVLFNGVVQLIRQIMKVNRMHASWTKVDKSTEAVVQVCSPLHHVVTYHTIILLFVPIWIMTGKRCGACTTITCYRAQQLLRLS